MMTHGANNGAQITESGELPIHVHFLAQFNWVLIMVVSFVIVTTPTFCWL